ncbi:MAG: hypothetical protein ABIK62_08210 [candidate division WOR-3 bacterium]
MLESTSALAAVKARRGPRGSVRQIALAIPTELPVVRDNQVGEFLVVAKKLVRILDSPEVKPYFLGLDEAQRKSRRVWLSYPGGQPSYPSAR